MSNAMQMLSAVSLSSWRDTSRTGASPSRILHIKKEHKPAASSDKVPRCGNGRNTFVSRPRSWLPGRKHQRPVCPAFVPRGGGDDDNDNDNDDDDEKHQMAAALVDGRGGLDRAASPLPDLRSDSTRTCRSSTERTSVASSDGSQEAAEWADSIRILIKETEDAFQAVRDVLGDSNLKDGGTPCESWLAASPLSQISSPKSPAELSQHHHHPVTSPLTIQRGPSSPRKLPLLGPEEKASEDARQKARRTSIKGRKCASANRRASVLKGFQITGRRPSWVDHLLTGAGLKRIEADEMITAEQIRQFREGRWRAEQLDFAVESRQSSDSAESESSATSEESSASTAQSSDHMSLYPAALPADAMDPMDHAVVRKDFSAPPISLGEGEGVSMLKQQQQQRRRSAGHHPDPPPRNPERSNKRSTRLPTIPEAEPVRSDDCDQDDDDDDDARRASQDRSLRSRFSRGSIGSPPPPVGRQSPPQQHIFTTSVWDSGPVRDTAGPSSTGTASRAGGTTYREEGSNDSRTVVAAMAAAAAEEEEEQMCDQDDDSAASDVVDWFQDFGFESHGQLIQDDLAWGSRGDSSSTASSTRIEASSTTTSIAEMSTAPPIRFLTTTGPPRVWRSRGEVW